MHSVPMVGIASDFMLTPLFSHNQSTCIRIHHIIYILYIVKIVNIVIIIINTMIISSSNPNLPNLLIPISYSYITIYLTIYLTI